MSVYGDCGPFKSWLIPAQDNQHLESDAAIKAIEDSLHAAIENDDQNGATGKWVGLLGFSQGAKICASLLLCQQVREERLGLLPTRLSWRFAILLAGRGPLVALDRDMVGIPGLVDASNTSMTALPDEKLRGSTEHILYVPTVHVHGTRDPGLLEHRKLLAQYCEDGTARLMEWDGEHRVPIRTNDVLALVGQIWDIAYETGVMMKENVNEAPEMD
jgi:predicted esterase